MLLAQHVMDNRFEGLGGLGDGRSASVQGAHDYTVTIKDGD